jgi:hypothetical protein
VDGRVQAMLRPWIKRIKIDMTATTNRMWMNPLIVYAVTIPSNQSTIRITAIVPNICFCLCPQYGGQPGAILATIAQSSIFEVPRNDPK